MISADHPWKEVCEKKLTLVFALLYEFVYDALDWSEDYEPLDQELRKHAPASKTRGRVADRLIKAVAQKSGDPRYFHLEVQGKKVRDFRRRIHQCNLRVEERFNAHVVSMVILTDENPNWRPRSYVSGLFPIPSKPTEEPTGDAGDGKKEKKRRQRYLDERTLRFLTVKLIDYRGKEAELEAMENPMGLFVSAHLEAMRTRKDAKAREDVKLRLLRNLRQRKMDAEGARFWFTCLDWFLQLPPEREQAVTEELDRLDKEENVGYLSYIERQALEKGRGEGRLEALGWYLKMKYGEEALTWMPPAASLADENRLKDLYEGVFKAESAEKIRELLAAAANVPPKT